MNKIAKPVGQPARYKSQLLDAAIALALLVGSFTLFSSFSVRLAETHYFDFINLAFDWDPAYFVRDLTEDVLIDGRGISFKHPLWMLFRVTAAPFLALDYPHKAAAALSITLLSACAVALAYVYFRLSRISRPVSLAASLFFACSSTVVFTSMVPESYAWANFSIVLFWCLFAQPTQSGAANYIRQVAGAALLAGVTLTNLAHAVFAQFAARYGQGMPGHPWRRAVKSTALYLTAALLLMAMVLLICQPGDVWNSLTHPLQAAKEVYWQRTVKGDKVGLLSLLEAYFLYSFFAPDFSIVMLSKNVSMLDFRAPLYDSIELLFSAAWLSFWLLNVGLAMYFRIAWKLLIALLLTVAFNLLFHLDYQFRGSLYIYAAHLHFPILALGLSAAPWIQTRGQAARVLYLGSLLVLSAAAAWTNLARADQFVSHFERSAVPAQAPEISPTPPRTVASDGSSAAAGRH